MRLAFIPLSLALGCGGIAVLDEDSGALEPTPELVCPGAPATELEYVCIRKSEDGSCVDPALPLADTTIALALSVDRFTTCSDEIEKAIEGDEFGSCAPASGSIGSIRPCTSNASCMCSIRLDDAICGPDPGRPEVCCYLVTTREEARDCT